MRVIKEMYLSFVFIFVLQTRLIWGEQTGVGGDGDFTDAVFQRLKNRGFRPRRILDIGCFVGAWTEKSLEYWPDAHYVLVDANPSTYIKAFQSKHKNVEFHHAVLYSDGVDEVEWFSRFGDTRATPGDSIHRENTCVYREGPPPEKRPSTTLKKLLGSDTFDLIKIDTQGSEIPIMKGGIDLIKRAKVVIAEFPFYGQYNAGVPSFAKHVEFMESIGFMPYDIIQLHQINVDGIFPQLDMLFFNTDESIWPTVKDDQKYIDKDVYRNT